MLVAIAEMALAGSIGANLRWWTADAREQKLELFSEWQGTYIATGTGDWRDLAKEAAEAGVQVGILGYTYGQAISFIDDSISPDPIEGMITPLADLRAAHESFFKEWMEQ
jgi:phosphoribosylformylglycinamidine (FGAM) synthase-like enzyme